MLFDLVCLYRRCYCLLGTEEEKFLGHALVGNDEVVGLRIVLDYLVGCDVELAREDGVGIEDSDVLHLVVICLTVHLVHACEDAEVSVIFDADLSLSNECEVLHADIQLGAVNAVRAARYYAA